MEFLYYLEEIGSNHFLTYVTLRLKADAVSLEDVPFQELWFPCM